MPEPAPQHTVEEALPDSVHAEAQPAPRDSSLVESELLVESDLLVEDVSIDGMCGVY